MTTFETQFFFILLLSFYSFSLYVLVMLKNIWDNSTHGMYPLEFIN